MPEVKLMRLADIINQLDELPEGWLCLQRVGKGQLWDQDSLGAVIDLDEWPTNEIEALHRSQLRILIGTAELRDFIAWARERKSGLDMAEIVSGLNYCAENDSFPVEGPV